MSAIVNLTNKKIGKLTVINIAYRKTIGKISPRTVIFWRCKCDCGKETFVPSTHLISGHTLSCGCNHLKYKYTDRTMSSKNALYHKYINSAKKAGRVFDIGFDEFFVLVDKPCFYCGTLGYSRQQHHHSKIGFNYNGLDRIDNTKGYTVKNVVPCCGQCNIAKHEHSQKNFIEWIERTYCNLKSKVEVRL